MSTTHPTHRSPSEEPAGPERMRALIASDPDMALAEYKTALISRNFWKRQYTTVSEWHREKLWMLFIIARYLGLGPDDLLPIGTPDASLKFGERIMRKLDAVAWSGG